MNIDREFKSKILVPFAVLAILGTPATPAAQADTAKPARPGLHERTLRVGGVEREYLLHIPRGYTKRQKRPLPLVLMLHGRTSNGAAASRYYGWRPLADKERFFVVFPTAVGTPTSWQLARRGRPTPDSEFLARLIDTLVAELAIDTRRVFMTGHSSGGFMSFSFATTHAEKVAAIGPVAGLVISTEKPAAPVSVISFHGMADRVVAYDSKSSARWGRGMPSAMESAANFAKHNGCAAKPTRTDIAKGRVHVDRWSGGRAGTEVVLYSIEGGDHGWPSGRRRGVAATPLIWEFFANHGRPDPAEKGVEKGKDEAKKKRRRPAKQKR